MENRQGKRRSPPKRKENAADLRQMDLWTGGTKPEPGPETGLPHADTPSSISRQSIEINDIKSENLRPRPADTTPAKVTVTVSSGARPGVVSAARSLPALTRRQHELLDYLRRRQENGELPPSLTTICRDLGLVSRGSLHKQVVALVQAGVVEAMHGKQRGVRLAEAANDEGVVPLMGAIAAGRPIEALARDETIQLPPWLRPSADCFALRVRGDSMRDAGILDGDIVVVEARGQARNGELVVALVDHQEATLKRIEQRPGEVLLHAENAAYPPQRYASDRIQIQGVVVAALRRY
jgi:repressor LexA